jgi:hypothetical protein
MATKNVMERFSPYWDVFFHEEKIRAEGYEQARKDTARIMLMDGMPYDKVSRYTGFSHEELDRLADGLPRPCTE